MLECLALVAVVRVDVRASEVLVVLVVVAKVSILFHRQLMVLLIYSFVYVY